MMLVLRGHCPSKKNLWRRGRAGRMYLDDATAALIESLVTQARQQWHLPPALHPELTVQFYARDRRGDRDNKLTTVLDCLHAAGVIVNDNIAKCNGRLILLPAVIDKKERVLVEVL